MEEVHHAKEEGIIFDLLTNPVEILVGEDALGERHPLHPHGAGASRTLPEEDAP